MTLTKSVYSARSSSVFILSRLALICDLVNDANGFKRPDANFGDLEGIEDVHGDGVGALISEVPSDSGTQTFVGLAYVDWLAVVIVEGIDAAFGSADFPTFRVGTAQESLDFPADRRDITGLSFRL